MDTSAKTLITGATGLVGSAVARKLVAEGFSVRALARPNSPRFHLDGLDLEFVAGDIRDADSIRRAMAGVRYVFHVAADYRLWARDPSQIFAANVDGTRIVMEEAKRAGVERIVYTSSVATLGLRADGSPADETVALSVEQGIGPYKRSKIAAERLVEAMVADQRTARGHRQSLDADWAPRCQADADRAHHRRNGARTCARISRYRSQSRPRR